MIDPIFTSEDGSVKHFAVTVSDEAQAAETYNRILAENPGYHDAHAAAQGKPKYALLTEAGKMTLIVLLSALGIPVQLLFP